MARSEEPLESSLSSRWFIPGGVQRARPKKIEALSREEEREEEGAPEEETHTHARTDTDRGGRARRRSTFVRRCIASGARRQGGRGGEGEEVYTWRRE